MTATDKKIAIKVLGSASSMSDPVDALRALSKILADTDGVPCGVCQRTIAKTREDVSVELCELVVARELVLAALLLCPRCAAKWLGEIHFVLKVLRPEKPIGAPDVKAGDARALH